MPSSKSTILFFLLFIATSCSPEFSIDNPSKEAFPKLLGNKITIKGKATNAKLGATLTTENDNIIVWIDEMQSWPKGFYQRDKSKTLIVTGTLIEKYDLPVFISNDDPRTNPSGIPVPKGTDLKEASNRYLLKDINWKIVPD